MIGCRESTNQCRQKCMWLLHVTIKFCNLHCKLQIFVVTCRSHVHFWQPSLLVVVISTPNCLAQRCHPHLCYPPCASQWLPSQPPWTLSPMKWDRPRVQPSISWSRRPHCTWRSLVTKVKCIFFSKYLYVPRHSSRSIVLSKLILSAILVRLAYILIRIFLEFFWCPYLNLKAELWQVNPNILPIAILSQNYILIHMAFNLN